MAARPKNRYMVACCQLCRYFQCFSVKSYKCSLGPSAANCSATIPVERSRKNLQQTPHATPPGLINACLPTKEKKSMTEFSKISRRRCEALLANRVEPMFLFLRVACHREYFPVHQIPATRKKLPGRAWPLKLPMTHNACRRNQTKPD